MFSYGKWEKKPAHLDSYKNPRTCLSKWLKQRIFSWCPNSPLDTKYLRKSFKKLHILAILWKKMCDKGIYFHKCLKIWLLINFKFLETCNFNTTILPDLVTVVCRIQSDGQQLSFVLCRIFESLMSSGIRCVWPYKWKRLCCCDF